MTEKFCFSYLEANPHYYDYFHYLNFAEDGSVKFADGAGQAVNSVAEGNYKILQTNSLEAKVEFFNLCEVNVYQNNEKVRNIEPLTIKIKKEEGIFPFAQEVVWRIEDKNNYPCFLYRTRYIFEIDPLSFAREKQEKNLYYKIEKKELFNSARYYYAIEDKKELSLIELNSMGISKEIIFRHGAEKSILLQ